MTKSTTLLTIGELATQSGISAITLRYYEKCGLLKDVTRSEGGHRLYHIDCIEKLNFINNAKLSGFSLEDIQDLISLQNEPTASSNVIKSFVENKITEIDNKIQALRSIKTNLEQLAATCDGKSSVSHCAIIKSLKSSPKRKKIS